MGKRILFKKIKVLNYLLSIFMASSMIFPSFSYAISGTINFTGIDEYETGPVITDGQAGDVAASDIPGIDIDIFGSNDKINPIGKFIYLDF